MTLLVYINKLKTKIISKISYRSLLNLIMIAVLLVLLHRIARKDYLLFHTLVEFFSIIVAFALFSVTWNSKKMLDNSYLIIVGIAALFIGLLDLFHVLTYRGMHIIPGPSTYASEFWVATRFFESMVFLLGFFFLGKKIRISYELLFLVYSVITVIIIFSILYWKIFPVCYIEGVGQTTFKIWSEYVIILIFFIAMFFLIKNRYYFHKEVYHLLLLSIIFTVISEFYFSLYYSVFGFSNQLGHYFKLAAFYMIYKAIIETGFIKPNEIIYRNLVLSQEKIDQYNKRLQKQIVTRDKLFSLIAHDLRSPFTALLWYAELLYKEGDKYSTEKIREYSESIYKIGNNTVSLLENLLDWARLKAGALKAYLVNFNMSDVIQEMVRLYSEVARNKNISLSIDLSEGVSWVYADREMIKTILRNLISNAIKFTDKGGSVIIKTSNHNNLAMVTVSDTGSGIAAGDMDKIFKEDINWTTRGTDNEKGSGLGLQLCKEFVEKNNGKIWVESEEGKGTRFMFTIPWATDFPDE